MRQKWLIRLGALEWQRFTHLQPADGMELIGSVRRGAQMGALARLPDQRYVQVNGDFLSTLSQAQIRRALNQAQTAAVPPARSRRPFSAPRPSGPPANYVASSHAATPYTSDDGIPPAPPSTTAPIVTIKRRRRVVLP